MTISPTRLALGRKLRGMTLAELGRATDLSPQTISRYERNTQEPTSASIERIASALNLPAEFFRGADIDNIPIDAVSFRALSKTPAFRRDAALAASEIASLVADWISERYSLPTPDLPSIRMPDNSAVVRAEDIARRVRAQWGLDSRPVPNMVHLLEAHGVRIFSLAQEVRDVDAFALYRSGMPFVFIDTGKTAERQRFDAAHELGHLIMHQGPERNQGRLAERQADRFAAAFLMPRDDVYARNLHNAPIDRIIQASRRWKVSAMALTHRLGELGLLTEWGYRSSCEELSKRGYRRGEPGSRLIPESSQVLEKVLAHLRSTSSGVRAIIDDLNLTVEEFNRHVFGLATTVHHGKSQVARDWRRNDTQHLSVVSANP